MIRRHRRSQAVPRRRVKRWVYAFAIGVVVGFAIARATSAAATTAPSVVGSTASPLELTAVRATVVARHLREDPPPASDTASVPARDVPPMGLGSDDPAAILAIITNAAVEYGQDPARMIAVARCESSLRSDAVGDGGQALGLWQFHPETYIANARRLFKRDASPDERLDPISSSLVAAWMWSIGQSYQWTCAR